MIIVDNREHGIYDELRQHDVPVCEAQLEFGDAAFEGHGEGEDGKAKTVHIGCERKRLGVEKGRVSTDLINSMKDRRLSGHQLQGMAKAYDFVYLFIEGMWRATANGDIEVSEDGRYWRTLFENGGKGQQRISHRQVMSYVTTLELKGFTTVGNRFAIRRTLNMKETASQYADLWHWFNGKKWSEHTSHQQVYAPGPEMQAGGHGRRGSKPSFIDPLDRFRQQYGDQAVACWKMAAQLDGVDTVRAQALAIHFRTPERMCSAGPGEWQKVVGIGPVTAAAAARLLREGKDKAK